MVIVGCPAVDALHFVPSFDKLVTIVDYDEDEEFSHTFRRMVGEMCGQIMDQLGYRPSHEDPVSFSYSFGQGTVYKPNHS